MTAIPAIARRLLRPERSTATSRNAAIGATLLARRAGNTAETTLTSVPATSEMITVPLEITTDPDGRSMPIADIIDASPAATPTPASRPVTEAIKPTASASTSTDDITCLRPAPIARNIAISLVRWATRIENEL